MTRNDTMNEYIFIEHPGLEERVQINKTALQRYQKEGWKIASAQFGHAKAAAKKAAPAKAAAKAK